MTINKIDLNMIKNDNPFIIFISFLLLLIVMICLELVKVISKVRLTIVINHSYNKHI